MRAAPAHAMPPAPRFCSRAAPPPPLPSAPHAHPRRSRFLSRASPILLLTERFYFFRRVRIKGARHVLFYGPPNVPHFYPEIVNAVTTEGGGSAAVGTGGVGAPTATVLFTRLDAPALERVVGSARAASMAPEGPKTSFVFI